MIAHIRKADLEIQTTQQHAESVSKLAMRHGAKAKVQAMTALAGFLHDLGKSTRAFATYITHAVKETGDKLERIDHSTAGAKYLYETYYITEPANNDELMSNFVVEIVGMTILSHHSGLQNFLQLDSSQSDYFRRVCKADLPYYDEACNNFFAVSGNKERVTTLYEQSVTEMKQIVSKAMNMAKQHRNIVQKHHSLKDFSQFIYFSLIMKYVFSCLIDADRTDARRFEENDYSGVHHSYHSFFTESYDRLIHHLKQIEQQANASTVINQLRRQMSKQCDQHAEKDSSIYQLSIPTGGGKTLASLRYALKHASLYKKDRIIYVVPYTTIIEQNADVIRNIVSDKSLVLEHHAHVIDELGSEHAEDYYENKTFKAIQLARDNWDHPLIFTTLVQFLDTFYAKGTRKGRRLHNLANAVIIFDEVQSVPTKHLPLFNCSLNFLKYFCNSSIILCTATQPTLSEMNYPLLLPSEAEMIDNLPSVTTAFKRVDVKLKISNEGWDAKKISQFAIECSQSRSSVLIILNTKQAVHNVYQQLKDLHAPSIYHLSTSMCPQHRKDILAEVKQKLKNPNEQIICVSTQLIEAGVDISFNCVIRSLAGLDSIAQAAGRCNRHGGDQLGEVYIVRARDEVLQKLPEIALGQTVIDDAIFSRPELKEDLLGSEAIAQYFRYFLTRASSKSFTLDKKLNMNLIELIEHNHDYHTKMSPQQQKPCMRAMFKTLEQHFEVIEAHTVGVLVPYQDEGRALITDLNEEIHDAQHLNTLLKKAQHFSVNVYRHTLHQLVAEDLLYPLLGADGVYALQERGYDEHYGLSLTGEAKHSMPFY